MVVLGYFFGWCLGVFLGGLIIVGVVLCLWQMAADGEWVLS
jgi:hypothetical protein